MMRDANYGDLGFYCLTMLYGLYAPACLISSFVVSRIGTSYTLILGSFCYLCFGAALIFPARVSEGKSDLSESAIWAIMLTASGINGFGSAILWVAQGEYLAQCANSTNRGLYNGVFWAIFNGSRVVGCIVASIVMERVMLSTFFMSMCGFGAAGLFMFFGIRKPDQALDEYKEIDFEKKSLCKSVCESLTLLVDKRMVALLPYMIYNSL